MKHLFIVTYGRSGSTDLSNTLNSIPGYCIRGENGGLLIPLSRAIGRAKWSKKEFGRFETSVTSPWWGVENISIDLLEKGLAESFTNAVLRPPADAECIGFKEIRYTSWDCSDTEFHFIVDFMLRAFNESRIIFLTRRSEAIAQSGWWRKEPDEKVRAVIEDANDRFATAAEKHPGQTLLLENEQFFESLPAFENLIEWLGIEYDARTLLENSRTKLTHLNESRKDADLSEQNQP